MVTRPKGMQRLRKTTYLQINAIEYCFTPQKSTTFQADQVRLSFCNPFVFHAILHTSHPLVLKQLLSNTDAHGILQVYFLSHQTYAQTDILHYLAGIVPKHPCCFPVQNVSFSIVLTILKNKINQSGIVLPVSLG